MNKTSIEWTDFTANPLKFRAPDGRVVWACEKLSAGCANCYAEHLSTRYGGTRRAGDWNAGTMATLTPFLDEKELQAMLRYKPANRKQVFVGDMTDVFGEWVPDELLDKLFAVMALCDGTRATGRFVTFQLLTKRADRLHRYLTDPDTPYRIHSEVVYRVIKGWRPSKGGCDWNPITPWPSPNVWIGVSVEDQLRADHRIPLLLQTPAAVRFISAEPLLSATNLRVTEGFCRACLKWTAGTIAGHCFDPTSPCFAGEMAVGDGIDWVIVGGESGHGARPFNVAWARSIVRQCKAAGVAVFVKQLGKNVLDRNDAGFDGCSPTSWPEEIEQRDAIEDNPHGFREEWQGADVRVRLRDSHGGDPDEWPADLRVRQFPKGAA